MRFSSSKLIAFTISFAFGLTNCGKDGSSKDEEKPPEPMKPISIDASVNCSENQVVEGDDCRAKTFLDYCIDNDADDGVKYTIEAIKQQVGRDSCEEADIELAALTTITFPDKGIIDIRPFHGLEKIVSVDFDGNKVKDISTLASLPNIEHIQLFDNEVGDLKPLLGLKKLRNLHMEANNVSDISPLEGLNLFSLTLSSNNLSDLTPLKSMSSLRYLDLASNKLKDFSPLKDLGDINTLMLDDNPLDQLVEKNLENCPFGDEVPNRRLSDWCATPKYDTSLDSLVGRWQSEACETSGTDCLYTIYDFKKDLKLNISFCHDQECKRKDYSIDANFGLTDPPKEVEGVPLQGIYMETRAPMKGLFVVTDGKLKLQVSNFDYFRTIEDIVSSFKGFEDTDVYSRQSN